MPFTIALTGGIASGKTAVTNAMAQHDVCVIDTDVLAREVVAPDTEGLAAVVSAFGGAVLTPQGTLDRSAMRKRVFADSAARKTLERILHPRIRKAGQIRLQQCQQDIAIYVIPLLVETGSASDFDRILVVESPMRQQLERVMARDEINADQARSMILAQSSNKARRAVADDLLVNAGSLQSCLSSANYLISLYKVLVATRH